MTFYVIDIEGEPTDGGSLTLDIKKSCTASKIRKEIFKAIEKDKVLSDVSCNTNKTPSIIPRTEIILRNLSP